MLNLRFSIIKSFYYQIFLACISSLFIFGFLLPKLDKVWISNSIYEIIKNDNTNFHKDEIATIGFNEPSLIFMMGTKTKVLFSLHEDFFEKKLYKYIIVEKLFLNKFYNIMKNTKSDYIILKEISGFNMAKNKWNNIIVFKLNK